MARSDRTALLTLAARQHGMFTTSQAVANGVERQALGRWRDRGEIVQVAPSVWLLVGSPDTSERKAMAAVLRRGSGAALAGSSAAWAWGVPGHDLDRIQVLRTRTGHPAGIAGSRSSRLVSELDVTVRRGVPVTTPVRTIFDLAGRQHEKRTQRDLNDLMSRGLVTLEGLDQGLARLAQRGRTGIRVMRALIAEQREKGAPVGSSLELLAERVLHDAGFRALERQVPLGDGDGFIARVDFVDRRWKLVLEIDSDRFHGGLVDRMLDEVKSARLSAVGWHVVRITEHELWWERDALLLRLRQLRASHHPNSRFW